MKRTRAHEVKSTLRCEHLRPDHWPTLERLFGPNGACGGCWCMWWRVAKGGKTWEQMQGAKAKRAFRALVTSGKARGVLAFDGSEPVGWCSLGPRTDFPRTERSRSYRRDDLTGVWSINCFYIPRAHRRRGVASALLRAATEACRDGGAEVIEAYPVPDDKELPSAFVWRGPLGMFLKQGYRIARRETPARPLVEAPR